MSGDHDKYHGTAEVPKREWVGILAHDANRIFFKDEYKALRETDVVALANFLTEVEDTLKEKNT